MGTLAEGTVGGEAGEVGDGSVTEDWEVEIVCVDAEMEELEAVEEMGIGG